MREAGKQKAPLECLAHSRSSVYAGWLGEGGAWNLKLSLVFNYSCPYGILTVHHFYFLESYTSYESTFARSLEWSLQRLLLVNSRLSSFIMSCTYQCYSWHSRMSSSKKGVVFCLHLYPLLQCWNLEVGTRVEQLCSRIFPEGVPAL